MTLRSTHTLATLEISLAAYEEIRKKLEAAGYQHAFFSDEGVTLIDMTGIAVAPPPVAKIDKTEV